VRAKSGSESGSGSATGNHVRGQDTDFPLSQNRVKENGHKFLGQTPVKGPGPLKYLPRFWFWFQLSARWYFSFIHSSDSIGIECCPPFWPHL